MDGKNRGIYDYQQIVENEDKTVCGCLSYGGYLFYV